LLIAAALLASVPRQSQPTRSARLSEPAPLWRCWLSCLRRTANRAHRYSWKWLRIPAAFSFVVAT